MFFASLIARAVHVRFSQSHRLQKTGEFCSTHKKLKTLPSCSHEMGLVPLPPARSRRPLPTGCRRSCPLRCLKQPIAGRAPNRKRGARQEQRHALSVHTKQDTDINRYSLHKKRRFRTIPAHHRHRSHHQHHPQFYFHHHPKHRIQFHIHHPCHKQRPVPTQSTKKTAHTRVAVVRQTRRPCTTPNATHEQRELNTTPPPPSHTGFLAQTNVKSSRCNQQFPAHHLPWAVETQPPLFSCAKHTRPNAKQSLIIHPP